MRLILHYTATILMLLAAVAFFMGMLDSRPHWGWVLLNYAGVLITALGAAINLTFITRICRNSDTKEGH